ncbi:MAG: hypothetical protein ACRD5L_16840, partial [Bryobacteraceae bacterium]
MNRSSASLVAPSAGESLAQESPRATVVSRYFEGSLYLLLLTAVMTVVCTGKLDLFSMVVAPVALVIKGWRRWRGHGAEISHRAATICVCVYFLFLPVDFFVWSRSQALDAPNATLYAALLTTVHLLLFAILIRAYSATTRRDHLFLALLGFSSMLAAAVL